MYGTIRRCPMSPSLNDLEGEMASIHYIRETLLPELVPCAYILLSQILRAFPVFWLMLYIRSTEYSDLLHDVSLQSDTNRMDAFNLAIVICPNLVKSSNPMRDVMMCTVPVPGMSTPSLTTSTATLAQSQSLPEGEGKTTLGIVIALCIRRYYEVFDEIVDRHEAVAPWRAIHSQEWDADGASSASGSSKQPTYVLGDGDDEDDIDDEMLVISVGMENKLQPHPPASSGPPSAWGSMPQPQWTKRHKSTPSDRNGARSIHNECSSSSAYNGPLLSHPHAGNSKDRSMISVEGSGHSKSNGSGGTRRGSITIGRSASRKGSGAAVEAVSVVAGGFFTSPTNGPKPTTASQLEEQDKSAPEDEEGKVLTVSQRRRIFESGT